MTGRRRDERGSVAILVSLMAVMLMGVAALSVDLGNGVTRKRDVQRQADFAALSAGGSMTGITPVGGTPSAAILNAIVASLNANQPQDDNASKAACLATVPKSCVTAAMLTDANLTNGDARYTATGLQVTAPWARVNWGLAAALGHSNVDVEAKATVNVYSPGMRVMPAFAVQGCDYGLQTLTDPPSGHAIPVTPNLAYPADTNITQLTGVTTSTGSIDVTVGAVGVTVTLTGKKWSKTTKIGFFKNGDTNPANVVQVTTFLPVHPPAGYTNNPSSNVTLTIPSAVANTTGIWYLRSFTAGTVNKWSTVAEAQPIRVGDAVPQCGEGSTSGNFGALDIPRSNTTPARYLAKNVAKGLQPPLAPVVHQTAIPQDSAPTA